MIRGFLLDCKVLTSLLLSRVPMEDKEEHPEIEPFDEDGALHHAYGGSGVATNSGADSSDSDDGEDRVTSNPVQFNTPAARPLRARAAKEQARNVASLMSARRGRAAAAVEARLRPPSSSLSSSSSSSSS